MIANFAVDAGQCGKKSLKTPSASSPCISFCQMDERSGLCLGCARTIDEIAGWSGMDDATKTELMAQLPSRRASAGLSAV
jgi:uncharacterized protein